MKRIARKMSLSAPSSKAASRTSSETSINTLGISMDNMLLDEYDNNLDYDMAINPANNMASTAEEIEQNMPIDSDLVPGYYKDFTIKHPLGNLILRMSAMNKELCKKLSIKTEDDPGLNEVCQKFVKAIQLERNRNVSKFHKVSNEIEDNILNKELNFHAINASVQPPTYFSSTPVLTTPSRMQEALKTFPTKSSQKFSGTQGSVNILEFLHSLNTAQSIMNLSKKEFLQLMQKSVTGKVYNLVNECISYEHDIGDLYHSLLTLYDNRMTSDIARKALMNYKAPRNQNLSKVQSHIMILASRIASQIPEGPSRTSMFNVEANNALIRSLPHNSANVVSNVINNLSARLQKSPSYVQTIKCLTKYHDTINADIARNGVVMARAHSYNTDIRPRTKLYALDYKPNSRMNNRARNNNKITRFGKKMMPHSPKYSINALSTENRYNDNPRHERVYNMNNNRRQKSFNRNDTARPNSNFKGLYCSLCGSKTHSADQICFKMRDEQNRIVETVPSFYPCEICLKKINKKLYHPTSMCFNRDKTASTTAKSD